MRPNVNRRRWRRFLAGWRDTRILLREFRQPLIFFILLILGAGFLYHNLAKGSPIGSGSFTEAVYDVLTLTFLQPVEPFPDAWYLQAFYFIMPIAGTAILALGLADFGILFFNRRARGKDWQMAVASTFNKHIVLVGLGHLGYRVVRRLYDIGQEVVVIELASKPHLTEQLQALGIPVIEDDATRLDILTAAGVPRARTIMLCTQDDSLNLEIALKARSLNPAIEVVIRIFDDEFADSLQSQFGFRALSATGMAAPLFAAAASSVDITPPITVEGQPHILARLEVREKSGLAGLTVNEIEEQYQTSLVYLQQDHQSYFHPEGSIQISKGASLAVFGTPERINQLLHENR